jgi:hypothetical protein
MASLGGLLFQNNFEVKDDRIEKSLDGNSCSFSINIKNEGSEKVVGVGGKGGYANELLGIQICVCMYVCIDIDVYLYVYICM